MLNWLKSLFASPPRAAKLLDLEAHLAAPDGGSLHGDAEFEAWDDGRWEFEAELDHPGGAPAGPLEVFVDGVLIGELTTRGSESELKLRAEGLDLAAAPKAGSTVEIKAAGAILVGGAFAPDR